jgi:Zn-dependent M32 family carboxypeptidase
MARVPDDGTNRDLGPLSVRLATIGDLRSAASVLAWDRQTFMPQGGVTGRAEQLAQNPRVRRQPSLHQIPGGP